MKRYYFRVSVYSHYFKLDRISIEGMNIINIFIKPFIQYGMVRQPGGRFQYMAVKAFAASNKTRTEFRLHINALDDFYRLLSNKQITKDLYQLEEYQIPVYEKLDLDIKEGWKLKDYQEPVVSYLKQDNNRSLFVPLQTGKGKTICALWAISELNMRTIIIVKPGYIEKWVEDITKTLQASIEDIVCVQGTKQLQALLELAENDLLDQKFIIISNRTMQLWIKSYEQFGDETKELGFAFTPDLLYEKVKAGIRLIDEVHQDFHLNFKLDLYTNVDRTMSLSATLMSHDPFMERMYEVVHPTNTRYDSGPLDRYIESHAILYRLDDSTRVRTTEYGSNNYSHMAFEKSILKNPYLKERYWKLIDSYIEKYYINTKKDKEKLAIFASTIDMCTFITNKVKYKYHYLDVRRYVEDDPYENLIDSDIRITTILSGGTAHDIPNLKTTILTIAIDSLQSNVQTLGRLRRLENSVPIFIYFTCLDIPKHVEYHNRKKKLLAQRASSYKEEYAYLRL